MGCLGYNEPKLPQQGLQAVPTGIPATSQHIFLHGNHISHVPAASYRTCCNFTVLWLHLNVLAQINAAAFAGLALLEQLNLSDNVQLPSLDPATFHGLGHLHTLHLDCCGLQELGLGLFRGLAALQYLYLQDNALQALPDDTFRDPGNLMQKAEPEKILEPEPTRRHITVGRTEMNRFRAQAQEPSMVGKAEASPGQVPRRGPQ
ncbi:hypothetical protein P7K49_003052 [Saguinus oedipus]|uniref:Uncharacterized protein n=1 Tax=Saguinus oedipus TaxID=9490 RepID=A0ABQ9WJ34_SAGOE|nr:hypothetical protein P7K49_003052 [Saguinus oedipus]